MSIPFIRIFTQTKGEQQRGVPEHVSREPAIEAMATRYLQAGGWYTIHKTGDSVRICCTDANLDVLTGLDVRNGPELLPAIDDLVMQSQNFIRPPTAREMMARKPLTIIH